MFASGTVSGMTIALVHLLFNISGILIVYPWIKVRYIPVILAEKLAGIAASRKWLAVVYVMVAFIAIPLVGIFVFS